MLDRHATSDLVRLRAALDRALRAAADTSAQGRHGALIALDGVCEYAMWLAVQYQGLPVAERANFHEAFNKLTGRLTAWSAPGRRGVVQMHSARNQAQHAGALPDPALMADWADSARAFVSSLVKAAFDVSLADVMLASAVDEPRLEELILLAERRLNADEPHDAFAAAVDAFLAARRRWREQQGDAYWYMPTHPTFEEDPRHWDSSDRATDYADVGVFTTDLGEYHWLLAARRLAADGIGPSLGDAERALLFAYDWILRWQRFDAAYPRDRWMEESAAIGPRQVGDGETPEIVAATVAGREHLRDREWYRIVADVANVPERGRGDWGADMSRALATVLDQHGLPSDQGIAGQRKITGELTFFFDTDLEGSKAAEVLAATIEEATMLHRRRRETEHAIEAAELEAVRERFATRAPDLFGEINDRVEVRDTGEVHVLTVEYLGTPQELAAVAQIFQSNGGTLAGTSFSDEGLAFEWAGPREDGLAQVDTALAAATVQVAHMRELNQRVGEETDRFRSSFVAALGVGGPMVDVSEE